jgi:hypothetical protein
MKSAGDCPFQVSRRPRARPGSVRGCARAAAPAAPGRARRRQARAGRGRQPSGRRLRLQGSGYNKLLHPPKTCYQR